MKPATKNNMPTITARPGKTGKRWRCEVRLVGFPRTSETFARRRDALAWGRAIENDMLSGKYSAKVAARLHTFADLVDLYLNGKHHLRSRSEVYHADKKRYVLYWKKVLGEYALENITPAIITEKRDALAKAKTITSMATVNRYVSGLSSVLEYGVSLDKIPYNPTKQVKRLKEPRHRVRFLDDTERKRILRAAALERYKPMLLIVVLAIATGARKGEILGILRRNVLLEEKKIIIEETKNDQRRTLHIDGYPLQLLTDYLKATAGKRKYLFQSKAAERPFTIDREWYRIVDRSGVTNFRFHDLRHTAASYFALDGADIGTIASILGHSDIQTTRRYAHLTDAHIKTAAGKMQRKIFLENVMQKGGDE